MLSAETARRLEQLCKLRNFQYLQRTMTLAPVVVAVFAFYMLGFSSQIREVYFRIIEGDANRGMIGILSATALGAAIYCWHHDFATRLMDDDYADHGDPQLDRFLYRIRDLKALLLAALPLLGIAWGFHVAADMVTDVDSRTGVVGELMKEERGLGAFARSVIALPTNSGLLRWTWSAGAMTALGTLLLLLICSRRNDPSRRVWVKNVIKFIWFIALSAFLVAVFYPPATHAAANAIGSFGVFCTIMISMVALLSILTRGHKILVPLMVLGFLAYAGILIYRQLYPNSGEVATSLPSGPTRARDDTSILTNEFDKWLAHRKERFQDRPMPIFIFAIQGGGIYAASAGATLLARLEDRCPGFSQQVFAVSAVSGGAVGTTIFNSIVSALDDRPAQPCATIEATGDVVSRLVRRTIRHDHLAPMGAFIIPDLLTKPFGGAGARRPEAIEQSFADALHDLGLKRSAGSIARQTYRSQWSPTSRAPAAILNTTWVETGYRVAFAPFPLRPTGDGTLYSFKDDQFAKLATKDTSSIQAASVSARFPGAMPALQLTDEAAKRKLNFVDGGYADNSGLTTAHEIFTQLRRHLDRQSTRFQIDFPKGIDLRLVVLTESPPEFDLAKAPPGTRFSDIVAPITALLNVRSLLSQKAVVSATEQRTSEDKIEPADVPAAISGRSINRSSILVARLNLDEFPLVLGWTISDFSNSRIRLMLGDPELCTNRQIGDESTPGLARARGTIIANSCVQREILSLFAPGFSLAGIEPKGASN